MRRHGSAEYAAREAGSTKVPKQALWKSEVAERARRSGRSTWWPVFELDPSVRSRRRQPYMTPAARTRNWRSECPRSCGSSLRIWRWITTHNALLPRTNADNPAINQALREEGVLLRRPQRGRFQKGRRQGKVERELAAPSSELRSSRCSFAHARIPGVQNTSDTPGLLPAAGKAIDSSTKGRLALKSASAQPRTNTGPRPAQCCHVR